MGRQLLGALVAAFSVVSIAGCGEDSAWPDSNSSDSSEFDTVKEAQIIIDPDPPWLSLGPQGLDRTITISSSKVSLVASGRATTILPTPGNPRRVFLGTAGGGVWLSPDITQAEPAWEFISLGMGSQAVGALAFESNTSILVGTGENNFRRDTYYGAGIFNVRFITTTDVTTSFWRASEFAESSDRFRFGAIQKLLTPNAADPLSLVYAAVSAGKTTTKAHAMVFAPEPMGGFGVHRYDASLPGPDSARWSRILGSSSALATDLEMAPVTTGSIFAGVMEHGIYQSVVGNDTSWCLLNPNPGSIPNPGASPPPATCPTTTGLPAAGTFDHVEVAVVPGSPVMYAMFGLCPFGLTDGNRDEILDSCVSTIYRSADEGLNWVPLSEPTGARSGYSRYTHTLTIHPSDPNTITYGGVDLWRFVVTNAGTNPITGTWTNIGNANITNPSTGTVTAASVVHPDHQDFVIVPGAGDSGNDLELNASDGGLYYTTTGNTGWRGANKGLITTQIHGLGVDLTDENPADGIPKSTAVLAGLQDNNNVEFVGTGIWRMLPGAADGAEEVVRSPNSFITSVQDSITVQTVATPGGSVTTGLNFTGVSNAPTGNREQWSSWMPIFEQHEATKRVFMAKEIISVIDPDAASPMPVAISPIFDNTNYPASDCTGVITPTPTCAFRAGVTERNIITAMDVSESDENDIVVGLYDGDVWISNGGVQPCTMPVGCWTQIDQGTTPLPDESIGSVAIVNRNVIYVAFNDFNTGSVVWKTVDGGANWSPAATGIDSTYPANILRIDPRDTTGNTLWLGTDRTVYLTEDGGAMWSEQDFGLDVVPIFDIEIDADRNRIFIGTHGRGVYVRHEAPLVSNFEGWTEDGIWDIPIYGTGFGCVNCGCTLQIFRADNTPCLAAPSNIDAMGGEIVVSNGTLTTTRGTTYQNLPVAWGCFNGNCAGGTTIQQCNMGSPVSRIELTCGSEVVNNPIRGECPQGPQPVPSELNVIRPITGGAPAPLLASLQTTGVSGGSFFAVPIVAASPANGGDRQLCHARVDYLDSDTTQDLNTRVRDAINASPECQTAGVTALLQGVVVEESEDALPTTRVILSAPGIVGAQILIGVRAFPGQAVDVCFSSEGLGGYVSDQLAVMQLTFDTGTEGAFGGSVAFAEASPLGTCSHTISTSAGDTPADIASNLTTAFQTPGLPGPVDCPASSNPRDMVQEGDSVITILPTNSMFCIFDDGVGFTLNPHGVDVTVPEIEFTVPPEDVTVNDCGPVDIGQAEAVNLATVPPTPVAVVPEPDAMMGDPAFGCQDPMNRPCGEFPRGDTVIEWVADDGAGNTATEESTVTVDDTTPPVFDPAPEAISVAVCSGGSAGQLELSVPTAEDRCIGPVDVEGTVISANGQTVSIPISPTGQVSLPVGSYVVRWVASDGITEATLEQDVTVLPGLYANQEFQLRDRSEALLSSQSPTAPASIVNRGNVLTQVGDDALSGSVLSIANVVVDGGSVLGSVTSPGTISTINGGTISGSRITATPVLPPFPSLSGVVVPPPTGGSVFVNSGTIALAPGSYDVVIVNSNPSNPPTLELTAGDYYFQRFTSNMNSLVELDGTGPVRIFAQQQFDYRGAFRNTDGTLAEVFVGFLGTNQVTMEAPFRGVLVAPLGRVEFGTSTAPEFSGQVFARTLWVRPDTTLVCLNDTEIDTALIFE